VRGPDTYRWPLRQALSSGRQRRQVDGARSVGVATEAICDEFFGEYSVDNQRHNSKLPSEREYVPFSGAPMKQTKMLVNWLVACAVAFAMVTSASAQSAKERSGKVVKIKGSARFSTGNSIWQPLSVGTLLKAGALVQTAKDSFADIALIESDVVQPPTASGVGAAGNKRPTTAQDLVRLSEDSVLAIDKLTVVNTGAEKVTETQLDLRSGRILGSVKKMAAASRFEVKVPNGVAGIRGTLFAISADGVVSVGIGQVVISWTKADGSTGTQVVSEGWQFDVRSGELTKIPDVILNDLRRLEVESLAYFTAPTTRITVDQTILFVSPN